MKTRNQQTTKTASPNRRPTSARRTNAAGRELMAALEEIKAAERGEGPPLTVRQVTISEPGEYDPRKVKTLRQRVGVSQGVFARLMGVSPELVQAWEHGTRHPAPLARRMLDQISDDPAQFLSRLLHRRTITSPESSAVVGC
jgi:putative transcriptional regulator